MLKKPENYYKIGNYYIYDNTVYRIVCKQGIGNIIWYEYQTDKFTGSFAKGSSVYLESSKLGKFKSFEEVIDKYPEFYI